MSTWTLSPLPWIGVLSFLFCKHPSWEAFVFLLQSLKHHVTWRRNKVEQKRGLHVRTCDASRGPLFFCLDLFFFFFHVETKKAFGDETESQPTVFQQQDKGFMIKGKIRCPHPHHYWMVDIIAFLATPLFQFFRFIQLVDIWIWIVLSGRRRSRRRRRQWVKK